jgi:hypothetical protein
MERNTIPKELEQFILNLSTEKLEIATEIIKALSKTQILEKEPTFIKFKVQKEEQENMFLMLNCQEHVFTAIQKQMPDMSRQLEKNGTRERTQFLTQEEEKIGLQRREQCFSEVSENSELPRINPEKETIANLISLTNSSYLANIQLFAHKFFFFALEMIVEPQNSVDSKKRMDL